MSTFEPIYTLNQYNKCAKTQRLWIGTFTQKIMNILPLKFTGFFPDLSEPLHDSVTIGILHINIFIIYIVCTYVSICSIDVIHLHFSKTTHKNSKTTPFSTFSLKIHTVCVCIYILRCKRGRTLNNSINVCFRLWLIFWVWGTNAGRIGWNSWAMLCSCPLWH